MKKVGLFKTLALAIVALTGAASLTGCKTGPKWVDYTKDIKLTLDYTGHNFFEDGIGEVKLLTHIDGDTDHYKCIVGDTVTTLKSRYYGIDTPESTGAIQPWGQEASDYTKSMVTAANEHGTIVVSSPFNYYGKPQTDSTGSRYLSLVWVNTTKEHAPLNELTLLNLSIVQEGWSWAKNLSDIPEYVDTFINAQNQAEKFKKGMWQAEFPPNWVSEISNISVLDLKREVVGYLNDQSYENQLNGANVKFTGVVAGFCDNVLYVQEECLVDPSDESLGTEWGGINIFTGMTPISSKFTEVGTYLRIIGTAKDSENFGFQVTNTQGHFPISGGDPDVDCQVLLTAEENQGEHALKVFQFSASEQNSKLTNKDFENIYCRTHITNQLVCNKYYINASGTEVTLGFEGADFSVYLPFQYSGNPEDPTDVWQSEEKFIGKKFDVTGVLSYHKTTSGKITYQIIPCGSQDLVCLENAHGTTSGSPFNVSEAWTAANNATSESKVNYYVKGKISQIKSDSKLVISDGTKSVTVNYTKVSDSVATKNIVVGSTIAVFGTISSSEGGSFNKATIYSALPHGTTLEDPLAISEAIELASALASGASTEEIYFITGTVKSIDSEYDSSKRMTITITDGLGTDFQISPKMGSGIDYQNVIVGANVVVRGKLLNDNGKPTTVNNGTQVVAILA